MNSLRTKFSLQNKAFVLFSSSLTSRERGRTPEALGGDLDPHKERNTVQKGNLRFTRLPLSYIEEETLGEEKQDLRKHTGWKCIVVANGL